MPAENPYFAQHGEAVNGLSEFFQIANQLHQAKMQQEQIDNQNRQAQERQALAEQQFQQQSGQQSLLDTLKMNAINALPVSDKGTVQSQLPDVNGVPTNMPVPDPLLGLPGHGSFQSEVPAGLAGRLIAALPDGSRYQLPTGSEQFARGLAQQLEQASAMFPMQWRLKTAGMIPL